jgi:CRP-like cAMP-binding protein
MTTGNPIDLLKQAIAEFAARNPNSVRVLKKGYRLITEGDEGSDVFLIQHGYLSILVKNPGDGKQREVALRYDGDLVGETAILQRRGVRNASVEVVSDTASLVSLSRQDILRLIRGNAAVGEAIITIWELAAARRSETQQVLGGDVGRE